ncbi:FAD-dependent monooxygenase [Ramlibacter ginsenosidimutans]|uniref:FAD-dependent monooxygenase n=1 Tax=Ramlibacter ginsenosidimutans TaxID=502333 RepID=A0A934TQK5_9BURK|nr:FAD-dependent monooxygenase [Ramlibacter ginsenosidimutans]MBK6005618.1 FAD-dependent monooxygenase [Ramlibacter ginsenosidimutans]
MAKQKILIAGAGLGGLVAALALLRDGHEVQVFEQAKQLGEVGAGLQLSANATRVLSLVGVDEAVRAVASVPAGKQVRLWSTGQVWKLFDLGQESIAEYGHPYYTLYRPDLHAVLADAVRRLAPEALVLGAKVAGFDQTGEGVTLELEDGRRFSGDLLVGADGVHSRVRQGLFGPDAPTFSGCMAWRGVIPAAKLPEHLRAPVGTNWVGPGGHVIHYPLRRGELVNFVGVVERSDWKVESWTSAGSTEECAGDFPGWHEDVHTLIRSIQQPFKWALMVREPMRQWTVGRVTLLGDAAHPTLPFLAQGACMAIEDGAMLARCLRETPDAQQALRRFQDARVERTTRIVQGSAANTKRFHNPALASAQGAVEYVDREWNEARVRERYHWLFDYKVDRVPLPA